MSRALYILIALVLTLSACTKEAVSPPDTPERGPGDGEGILGVQQIALKIDFSVVGQVAERIYEPTDDPENPDYVTVKYTPAGVALAPKKEPKSAFSKPSDGTQTMIRLATNEVFFVTPDTSIAGSTVPIHQCKVSQGNRITLTVWRDPRGALKMKGVTLDGSGQPYPLVNYGPATEGGPGGLYFTFSGGCGSGVLQIPETPGSNCFINGNLRFDDQSPNCIGYTPGVGIYYR